MKFEQLTNQAFGAQRAGYRPDPDAAPIIDEAVLEKIRKTRGESAANNLIDGFKDFDGDLFRGEDGELYTVEFDFTSYAQYAPAIWQHVIPI